MKTPTSQLVRRDFIKQSALAATGLIGLSSFAPTETIALQAKDLVVGLTEGYTPHLGTLVSMLN